ncbi:bifunctional nicotinamidase/pyrazinamidase [Mangrovivirga cuniculi]|uniref:Nicotinamidase n=1 Tax=Mangrovivirga cuniculi TaxID=2715131 RepID=A0A4D7JTL0_9BACT|nr:bifunctional nicotinamidase/pyrazinamidase [Mangrovivirga cuniculi]QCK14245.1 bifunctional nicotinamidase/pyrazinamidase [Mangrovivirga cuniculi]
MKTLLIVDVQYDFLPGGALEVHDGDKIIDGINDIQDKFDLIVATQDWHPDGHFSFVSSHKGKEPFDKITLDNDEEQVLWPDHCVQGSKGAEISRDLNTNKVQAIIRKGTNPKIDSYSGFYDNFKEINTGLTGYLEDREVFDLYICGLAGDFCVYFTAMDAIDEGFNTFYIEDLTRPIDESGFEEAKSEMKKSGIKIIKSKNLD